jgi:hypothetical protein
VLFLLLGSEGATFPVIDERIAEVEAEVETEGETGAERETGAEVGNG